jgi:uncharacterized protein GlcG (DUF336 family)
MKRYAVTALFAASLFTSAPAVAQVDVDGYYLPMKVALKAAETAVDSCATHGWDVTATVVDPAGLVIVQLRGDHATVHTKDSSYRKAYTIVSMGPVLAGVSGVATRARVSHVSTPRFWLDFPQK